MSPAPVFVSVYNRPDHFQKCISALQAADLASETLLYIASDKEKEDSEKDAVEKVRSIIRGIRGFKKVVPFLRERNLGFPKSINDAWYPVLKDHGSAIFLEDDVLVAKGFLRFMNLALTKYENHPRVQAVCGWSWASHPAWPKTHYFLRAFSAWGFGCWYHKEYETEKFPETAQRFMNRWHLLAKANRIMPHALHFLKKIGEEGAPITDISKSLACIENDHFCVFPKKTLIQNIGHDGTGLHCTTENLHGIGETWNESIEALDEIPLKELACHRQASARYFRGPFHYWALLRHYKPAQPAREKYAGYKKIIKKLLKG